MHRLEVPKGVRTTSFPTRSARPMVNIHGFIFSEARANDWIEGLSPKSLDFLAELRISSLWCGRIVRDRQMKFVADLEC